MSQIEKAIKTLSLSEKIKATDLNGLTNSELIELLNELNSNAESLAEDIKNGECDFILADEDSIDNVILTQKISVKVGAYGLCVSAEGYSDHNTEENGEFILLDFFENKFRVIIWGDINNDDSTHIIPLDGAKISNRREED